MIKIDKRMGQLRLMGFVEYRIEVDTSGQFDPKMPHEAREMFINDLFHFRYYRFDLWLKFMNQMGLEVMLNFLDFCRAHYYEPETRELENIIRDKQQNLINHHRLITEQNTTTRSDWIYEAFNDRGPETL